MSTKLSAGRTRSTYEFIKANQDTFSVHTMCRLLGVAPSGYYSWLSSQYRTARKRMLGSFG